MASAGKLDDNVSCSICNNVFDKPVVLPCLHTFCEKCLEDHMARTQKNGFFRCGLCNENTKVPDDGVNGFKEASHFNSLTDSNESNTCDICQLEDAKIPADKMCIECSDKLCDSCSKVHFKTRVTRDHQVVSLKDFGTGNRRKDDESRHSINCKDHPNEQLQFCMICKNDSYFRQSVLSTDTIMKLAVNDIETKMATACETLDRTKKVMADYEKSYSFCSAEIDRVSTEIEQNFEKLHSALSEKEKQSKEMLHATGATILEILGKGKNESERQKQRVTDAIDYAKRLIECVNSIERLAKYEDAVENLQSVAIEHVQFQDVKPVFDVKLVEIPDVIGELNFERLTPAPAYLLQKAELVTTFNTLLDGERGTVCWGIHYSNEAYHVTGRTNGKMKLYDSNGHFRCFLDEGEHKLKIPLDVTHNEEGEIFVTDDDIHGVVVYDKQLKQKVVIRDVYKGYGRITCDNNRLIVTGGGELTIMDMSGVVESVTDKNNLGLDTFNPYYVTTSPTGYIITSDRKAKYVYILDKAGKRVIHTYTPKEELAFQNPHGVCCDKHGHIIIADSPNGEPGCLHVISVAGELLGVIVTKEDGLMDPTGVTISGPGHVSVLEWRGGVKVYKYLDI